MGGLVVSPAVGPHCSAWQRRAADTTHESPNAAGQSWYARVLLSAFPSLLSETKLQEGKLDVEVG